MGVDGVNSGVNVSLPKYTIEPTTASVPNFNGTDDKENTDKMLIDNKWHNISSALITTIHNLAYGKILSF